MAATFPGFFDAPVQAAIHKKRNVSSVRKTSGSKPAAKKAPAKRPATPKPPRKR